MQEPDIRLSGWELMQLAAERVRAAVPLAIQIMSRYTNLSYQVAWHAEGQIKLSIFIPSDKPYGTHLIEQEILVTDPEDFGLHAKLTRYNREVAAAGEPGFFFCDGHKRAEPIESLEPQDRIACRFYCPEWRAAEQCARVERDGPLCFAVKGFSTPTFVRGGLLK